MIGSASGNSTHNVATGLAVVVTGGVLTRVTGQVTTIEMVIDFRTRLGETWVMAKEGVVTRTIIMTEHIIMISREHGEVRTSIQRGVFKA